MAEFKSRLEAAPRDVNWMLKRMHGSGFLAAAAADNDGSVTAPSAMVLDLRWVAPEDVAVPEGCTARPNIADLTSPAHVAEPRFDVFVLFDQPHDAGACDDGVRCIIGVDGAAARILGAKPLGDRAYQISLEISAAAQQQQQGVVQMVLPEDPCKPDSRAVYFNTTYGPAPPVADELGGASSPPPPSPPPLPVPTATLILLTPPNVLNSTFEVIAAFDRPPKKFGPSDVAVSGGAALISLRWLNVTAALLTFHGEPGAATSVRLVTAVAAAPGDGASSNLLMTDVPSPVPQYKTFLRTFTVVVGSSVAVSATLCASTVVLMPGWSSFACGAAVLRTLSHLQFASVSTDIGAAPGDPYEDVAETVSWAAGHWVPAHVTSFAGTRAFFDDDGGDVPPGVRAWRDFFSVVIVGGSILVASLLLHLLVRFVFDRRARLEGSHMYVAWPKALLVAGVATSPVLLHAAAKTLSFDVRSVAEPRGLVPAGFALSVVIALSAALFAYILFRVAGRRSAHAVAPHAVTLGSASRRDLRTSAGPIAEGFDETLREKYSVQRRQHKPSPRVYVSARLGGGSAASGSSATYLADSEAARDVGKKSPVKGARVGGNADRKAPEGSTAAGAPRKGTTPKSTPKAPRPGSAGGSGAATPEAKAVNPAARVAAPAEVSATPEPKNVSFNAAAANASRGTHFAAVATIQRETMAAFNIRPESNGATAAAAVRKDAVKTARSPASRAPNGRAAAAAAVDPKSARTSSAFNIRPATSDVRPASSALGGMTEEEELYQLMMPPGEASPSPNMRVRICMSPTMQQLDSGHDNKNPAEARRSNLGSAPQDGSSSAGVGGGAEGAPSPSPSDYVPYTPTPVKLAKLRDAAPGNTDPRPPSKSRTGAAGSGDQDDDAAGSDAARRSELFCRFGFLMNDIAGRTPLQLARGASWWALPANGIFFLHAAALLAVVGGFAAAANKTPALFILVGVKVAYLLYLLAARPYVWLVGGTLVEVVLSAVELVLILLKFVRSDPVFSSNLRHYGGLACLYLVLSQLLLIALVEVVRSALVVAALLQRRVQRQQQLFGRKYQLDSLTSSPEPAAVRSVAADIDVAAAAAASGPTLPAPVDIPERSTAPREGVQL